MGYLSAIKFILIFGIIGTMFFGYKIYNAKIDGLKNDLQIEKGNINTLENTLKMKSNIIQQQSNNIESINNDFKNMTVLYAKLLTLTKDTNERIDKLSSIFHKKKPSGKKRNFTNIAIKKPKLLTPIINRASIKAMRCLEIASGALINITENDDKKNCSYLFTN